MPSEVFDSPDGPTVPAGHPLAPRPPAPLAATAPERTPPAVDLPRLLVQTGRSEHPLQAGATYRIGRNPASDIVLDDTRVSWLHATLRLDGDQWVLEDAGSSNGTFLDGTRRQRIEIGPACTVRVGHPELGPTLYCLPQWPTTVISHPE